MKSVFQNSRCVLHFSFLLFTGCLLFPVNSADAATDVNGDVDPFDPTTWNSDTDVYIGKSTQGALVITENDAINSRDSHIGYFAGASGLVDVNDLGTTWTTESLYIGNAGDGTLNVSCGGHIYSENAARIANENASSGVVNITDPNSLWSTYTLHVAYNGEGTMNITNGGRVESEYGWIGYNGAATGKVTVDGADSIWTNTGYFRVGYFGDGSLSITNGGSVKSYNLAQIGYVAYTDSLVAVDGEGSSWSNTGDFNVGINNRSLGQLRITHGGQVTSSSFSNLGDEAGSTGQATVDGVGSAWQTNNLRVGRHGTGILKVTDGGQINSDSYGIIGYYSDAAGQAVVDGNDSLWTIDDNFYIGYEGCGHLQITNGGGIIASDYGVLGYAEGATGEAMLDGAGSSWTNTNNLNLGRYGNGIMNVTNGALLISYSYGNLGYYSGATGKVTVSGADSIWGSSYIRVGRGGSGRLKIIDGGMLICVNDASIGRYAGSSGQAEVVGADAIWKNDSDLYIGYEDDGVLLISHGGLVCVAGTLTIDENGDGDGYINMASGGMLALAGQADDSLSSFLGLISGTDAIRYWDASTEAWAALSEAAIGSDYQLAYMTEGDLAGYTVLTVHVPGPPDPDVNRDGNIDLIDFTEVSFDWLNPHCNGPHWCSRADIDHSGDVGISDLKILADHWMNTTE